MHTIIEGCGLEESRAVIVMSRNKDNSQQTGTAGRWLKKTVQLQTLIGQRELLFVRVTWASTTLHRQLQEVCYRRRRPYKPTPR
jgi:hypothetical protein